MKKKLAVILVNLGTPEAATTSAVRSFLAEFLSDQRVVELPKLLWKIILYGVILPFRPKKVAHAYASIWMDGGSPLKVITLKQVEKLQSLLNDRLNDAPIVTYAMTYGAPNIQQQVDRLLSEGVERFLVLPLYPQYSATTTGAIYDQCARLNLVRRDVADILVHKNYCTNPAYISTLANSITRYWETAPRPQKLLFSFHGIPQRCVDLGDPYYDQCMLTATRTAELLCLKEHEWEVSFQSRLGRAQWLMPYTSERLKEMPKEGTTSVQVVCPAFASDCLETLEEIKVENRDVFIEAGGKAYEAIPCLNDSAEHMELLADIVAGYTQLS